MDDLSKDNVISLKKYPSKEPGSLWKRNYLKDGCVL